MSKTPRRLEKVISGGQLGADRAALEAARLVGVSTGGTLPFANEALKTRYGLDVLAERAGPKRTVAQRFVERSMKNVDDADATVAFRLVSSTGTDRTIGYCQTGKWSEIPLQESVRPHRPCLIIEDIGNFEAAADSIAAFVKAQRPAVLNVCGHRNDDTAGRVGFTQAVQTIMLRVFEILIRDGDVVVAQK